MVSLLKKLQANMVSKYEDLAAKKKQLEKFINQVSLLMKKNSILVQKVAIGGGGGGEEEKYPSF